MRRGGAYDRFIMMIEALLERGCRVHCLSLTPISIRHKGYKNHTIRLPGKTKDSGLGKGILLFFFPLYALWIGHQEKVDFLIAFGALYAFIESLAKWALRKPMITFLRGSFAFGIETQGRTEFVIGLSRWIEKIGVYSSDTIVSVNSALQEETRRRVRGRQRTKWEVLPNHIPPMLVPGNLDVLKKREKYGIPRDAKLLVTASVINRGKNIELLIECLRRITLDNLFLLVLGEGKEQGDFQYIVLLKELVRNLQLDDRVVFTGWVEKEELWRIFHAADVFILPSKCEGMPNVMLEALGCDLPCLGSNIPGIKDILYHGELLFDPFDEESLGNKIQTIFCHGPALDKVKRLCQERKKEFTFDWKKRLYHSINASLSYANCC